MLIDPAIRDWVLLPLLALVVVLHFVRLYAMRLMTSDAAPDVVELKQKGLVARSQRLRANGGFITGQGFAMRKDALLATTGGALGDASVVDKPPNPLAQPDMLKQQLLGMVRGPRAAVGGRVGGGGVDLE
jgi:ER membrane protein complex subunit 3